MSDSFGKIIVAILEQYGQMTLEDLEARLPSDNQLLIRAELGKLNASNDVRLSPRKMYYVPGHIAPSPSESRVARPSRSAAVEFGISSGSGEGFSFNGRIVMPGDVLTNRELMDAFRVSNMGGIRISKTMNVIVLITSVDNAVYEDRWVDGVFNYTGEGVKGDQTMSKGNLALADSQTSGTPLLLFFKRKANEYVFEGEVRLSGAPTVGQQKDERGLTRRVFIFPLSPT